MKTVINNKDLKTVLSKSYFELNKVSLDDGTIYLEAEMVSDNTLECVMYIEKEEIALTCDNINLIIQEIERYTYDLVEVVEFEPMSREEWTDKLEYYKN